MSVPATWRRASIWRRRSTRVAAFYRRQIEALRQVAGTDMLTGLLNRRGFVVGRCGRWRRPPRPARRSRGG
jgi:GGDEF domain-containing protein